MKRTVFFTLSVICCILSATAQTERPLIINKLQKKEKGVVQVSQDRRIDDMMNRFAATNAAKGTIRGFRLKIYSDYSADARRLTNDAKAKFMTNFPETEAYIDIKTPDWNLYVGNYRTITDAVQAKKLVERYFHDVIVVEADIDITKL